MATIGSTRGTDIPNIDATTNGLTYRTTPETYTTIDTLIKTNKDFVIPELVETYGDQGITGFLKLTGAINAAATSDQVDWWEAGRRHKTFQADGTGTDTVTLVAPTSGTDSILDQVAKFDVLMEADKGTRYIVTGTSEGVNVTIKRLDGETSASGTDYTATSGKYTLIGNMHPQGTDQPDHFMENDVIRRSNGFAIVKGRHEVAGSQATNIGWVDVGGGEYRWFMYNEGEARKRFEDQREMILLFGEINNGAQALTGDDAMSGSEGYFTQVETLGINVTGGAFTAISEIDDIIKELDKQGAPAEYAMYLNRTQDLAIDDLLAGGLATQVTAGLPGQFGAFNNDAEMAVRLGFKSFTRGGYTFHKHDWKLLNDPTLLGASTTPKYQGAMVPLANVTDPRTGGNAPSLAMYYKAAGGYSRELEHWVTGGGMLGFTNGDAGTDQMVYHYRSECNLCVRGANKHVVLKS